MKLERREREVQKYMKMEEKKIIQVMMYHMIVNLIYLLALNQIPLKKLLLELSGKKLCKMSMMHS